jgi:hypothetical protein
MSARTLVPIRDFADRRYPERGHATQLVDNLDPTNGNKILHQEGMIVVVMNDHVAILNLTLTYDDDAGIERTQVLPMAAGGRTVLQFPSRMLRHAADAAENGSHVWLTPAGSAGQIKALVLRTVQP